MVMIWPHAVTPISHGQPALSSRPARGSGRRASAFGQKRHSRALTAAGGHTSVAPSEARRRLGAHADALDDAQRALDLLESHAAGAAASAHVKAYHRKAAAQSEFQGG